MLFMLLTALENEDEKKALTRIYEKYNRVVFYVALKILKNKDIAEETAQDVWTKAVEKFERISCLSEDEVKPYLTVMTRNIALNRLKIKQAEIIGEEELKNAADKKSFDNLSAGMDMNFCGNEVYNEIICIIKNMPDLYRSVLELKYVLEWSNKEISAFLGINERKVAVRAFRGRKMVVEQLKKSDGGINHETCRA